jgi:pimeloyl-ACP methyl ester carboxylesterase
MVDWVFGRFWFTRPSFEDYLKHTVARQDHQTAERLSEIQAPTLVVVGGLDERAGGTNSHLAQSQFLATHIPRAELLVLDGMLHGTFWQDPDLLDDHVKTWIGKQRQPPLATTAPRRDRTATGGMS